MTLAINTIRPRQYALEISQIESQAEQQALISQAPEHLQSQIKTHIKNAGFLKRCRDRKTISNF